MHDLSETLEWYRKNQTARQIGFNPDGMCMKICRTARAIPARFASAKIGQDATPKKYRVYDIGALRAGMIIYVDDPNDSNKFGHIVTMVGRVPGLNWDSPDSVLVETNSVKKGELVVVRLSYFKKHWGDDFQFGATWLNGFELDTFTKKSRVERFRRGYPNYDMGLLDAAIRLDKRRDVVRARDRIDELMGRLTKDKRTRAGKVRYFFVANRVIRWDQLNLAANQSKNDSLVWLRNELRKAIKSLPDK